ncbi:MAG TPA: methionyl-tRNA formyltransferase [Allosphingosinicella sp.]|nr:methionyl-tRNA formyltransferase [Allosphingosinicella sp.]
MRIVFMGTPAFAVPSLDALIAAGHEIAAVYCQPPRRAGRGKTLQQAAVHKRAEAAGLEVRTPDTLRDPEVQQAFAALNSDAAVVASYGLILPAPILSAPRHGCFNIHASLLPRWRGAAPIHRAILAGDETTGVAIMKMEEGLDTGPVYCTRTTDIDGKNAVQLAEELGAMGAALMVEVLDKLDALRPVAQPADGATYAAKIEKREGRIDFTRPAAEILRRIRAFYPVPGAFFEFRGSRIKILDAEIVDRSGEPGTILDDRMTIACGDKAIAPWLVQREGRAAMAPALLLNGFAIPAGTRLGLDP